LVLAISHERARAAQWYPRRALKSLAQAFQQAIKLPASSHRLRAIGKIIGLVRLA